MDDTDQAYLLLHPNWLDSSLLLPRAHGKPLAPTHEDDAKARRQVTCLVLGRNNGNHEAIKTGLRVEAWWASGVTGERSWHASYLPALPKEDRSSPRLASLPGRGSTPSAFGVARRRCGRPWVRMVTASGRVVLTRQHAFTKELKRTRLTGTLMFS